MRGGEGEEREGEREKRGWKRRGKGLVDIGMKRTSTKAQTGGLKHTNNCWTC